MKSILLLSVCAVALATISARAPASQRDQDVIKNIAAIKKAIHEIENCLSAQAQPGDVSDIELPTDADESASDTDGRSTINRSIIPGKLRAKSKPNPISVGSFAPVVIKRTPHLVSYSKSAILEPESENQESAPQFNSTDMNGLVKSVYAKAIEEINAFSSIELSDDDDSLPQLGKLSLRVQIILDPEHVINDELAAKSLQVGQSAASRKLLATAIEKNKALIDEYSKLKKSKKVKNYFHHLRNLQTVLKTKAKSIMVDFLQSKHTNDAYELTTLGTTLVNSLSIQLAKNGVFRQYFVNKDGTPNQLDNATPIVTDSSEDNAVMHIIDLLSDMVMHQLDINASEFVFNNRIIKESSIGMDDSASNIYIVSNTHVEVAQFQEDESSFATGKQKNPLHLLSDQEIRSLKTVIITLIKQALRDSKLRSSAFHPLLTAINLKPDTEMDSSD